MSDEPTIYSTVNGRAVYNLVSSGGQTFIVDAVTGANVYVINGDIGGGGATVMTTEERTATVLDEGKLVYDSDLDALFAGDGVTSGGVAVGGGTSGVIPGYRMNDSGGTLNQDRFFPIETVSGSSVTLQAGHAYVINATSGGITLNCESFASNTFGLEGHATIYTANAGFVQQGANVYLADPLEPDSVNNCTIRFHGGSATIAVEDYFGGYIVLSGGTGSGSLPYGLASAGSTYIGFDASLNGSALDMSGAVTNGEKHVVGNGHTQTILTGGISCTSKTTFANLAMSGVVNSGGTMTLGDVFIPSGGMVSVSGGGLSVEKVVGEGSESVIDLGKTSVIVSRGVTASGSGVVFSGGSGYFGGFVSVFAGGSVSLSSCSVTGCSANYGGALYGVAGDTRFRLVSCTISGNAVVNNGGAAALSTSNTLEVMDSVISGNTAAEGKDVLVAPSSIMRVSGGCTIGTVTLAGGTVEIAGSNAIDRISSRNVSQFGSVVISSGAVIELTSRIDPGSGIEVVGGTCTVNSVPVDPDTYTSIVSSGGSAVINK